jgi:hypothetical protein
VAETTGKELRAFRISGNPPRIDGRLNDDVWVTADAIQDLVQGEPDNMAAPSAPSFRLRTTAMSMSP